MPEWLATSAMWHNIFALGAPVIEKILRPVMVYAFVVIALRISGKRELAQLNTFDLVVLLSLSNTVQNAIIGDDNSLSGGLIGAFSLLMFNHLVVKLRFRHRRLDQALEGDPTTLIERGKVKHENLTRELMTESELQTALNRLGIDTFEEVEKCVLEPGGTFQIHRKTPTTEERRYAEVMRTMKDLAAKLDRLAPAPGKS
jgi:uncharacterized membrane protein YcaP (DUF421 family)